MSGNLSFLLKVAVFSILSVGILGDSHHECERTCVAGQTKVCEYNFTIENYFVLSKACHNCPFTKYDCFRPHCVSANGFQRELQTVNRQMPGPKIEVCQGDIVRVWVENKMEDGSSTSIHWHGLKQQNSGFMDGVPMLTQCNIPPYEIFRYEFFAHNAGTHWYHSHTGLQLGDGVFGAFIVREPKVRDPNSALYDEDLSDHVMTVHDWQDVPTTTRYFEEMHDIWKWPVPSFGLVNGRGIRHNVTDIHNITGQAIPPPPTMTPAEQFNVTRNTRYRFRVISAATRCYFRILIEGHQMTMISTDGTPIRPLQVESFVIYPGERYDFVLSADKAVGNYWMKLQGQGDCSGLGGHGAAIIHYVGATNNMPTGDVEDFSPTGVTLNPVPATGDDNDVYTSSLRHEGNNENYEDEVVHVKHYISLQYQASDNTHYNHPVYYPNAARKGIITPTLNNITLVRPPAPLLTQWHDVKDKQMCNSNTLNTVQGCSSDLCECLHMLEVPLGQVVELFIVSHASDPHTMHLHGYTYRVVGSGMISQVDNEFLSIYLDRVRRRDENGVYPRNLVNPLMKDTVNVDGGGGYAIIRFKADNPGVWFFHCHNEGHLMQGMGMLIKVGDPEMFPKPPSYFPTCGGYSYQREVSTEPCGTSGITMVTATATLPITALLMSFIYM